MNLYFLTINVMALAQGNRVSGVRHMVPVLAGAALVAGDIVQSVEATGSNTVNVCATNKAVFGIASVAIASGATGDIDNIQPGDQFWVKIITGTMDATFVGKFADLTGALAATGITLTNTNNDVRIMGWDGKTTNFCIVEFLNTEVTRNL